MLSCRCVLPRLVAELQNALDSCAERQRQLERSLRIARRLLQAWYADPGTTRVGLPRDVRTLFRAPQAGKPVPALTSELRAVSAPGFPGRL